MRSDLIKKGFEKAPHRSLLRATGVIKDEKDFDKPFIGVCNSYLDLIPGHVHLQQVGKIVKDAVREAGGVPFEFNTIGVDDGIAMGHIGMRYSLPSRELIADCVETVAEAHRLDGLICIPNCDKIVPGMMIAAVRMNIPVIFVSGGPMKTGVMPDGTKTDLISIFEGIGEFKTGSINEKQLFDLERFSCPSCGSCSGMMGDKVNDEDEKELIELDSIQIQCGTNSIPTASVRIRSGEEILQESSTGDGPVDACFNAIERALLVKPTVESYTVRSVTSGKQAMGEAIVRIRCGERSFSGRGSSTDIIEASAVAYIKAINQQYRYTDSFTPPDEDFSPNGDKV